MDAATIIKTLIQLGVSVKDSAAKNTNNGKTDWAAVLKTVADDKQAKTVYDALITALGRGDFTAAIVEIDAKQTKLLAGRAVSALPHDLLMQYADLADARLTLATQQLTEALSGGVLAWLLDEALPTLKDIAPVVLPLLL